MPRKNHPEKRMPSKKKMRKMIRKGMEKGENNRLSFPPGNEDEYGF